MSNPVATAEWERTVFAAFAKVSGLGISGASISSCKEPMPDISGDVEHASLRLGAP